MTFLRKLWAGWAVLLFIGMMFFSIPIILFNMIFWPGARALKRNMYFLYHQFTPLFLKLVGIKLNVTGLENINHKRPSVIICNHRSALDFIVNAYAWPGIYRYLAKTELTKVPVFGWIVKKMCVLVDRSSAMSRARSMVSLKQHVEAGWSIFIYPEGSRNTTTEPITDFFDGAFRLAIQSGAPLAVSVIKNIGEITSSARSVDLWPGTVHIHWCGAIETKGMAANQINELRDQARAMMVRELSAAQNL